MACAVIIGNDAGVAPGEAVPVGAKNGPVTCCVSAG
jgi:hypothetical protein